jgi:hypothetical protein
LIPLALPGVTGDAFTHHGAGDRDEVPSNPAFQRERGVVEEAVSDNAVDCVNTFRPFDLFTFRFDHKPPPPFDCSLRLPDRQLLTLAFSADYA